MVRIVRSKVLDLQDSIFQQQLITGAKHTGFGNDFKLISKGTQKKIIKSTVSSLKTSVQLSAATKSCIKWYKFLWRYFTLFRATNDYRYYTFFVILHFITLNDNDIKLQMLASK